MEVEVAVSSTLPMSKLLGTDVPELSEGRRATEEAMAVTTQAQARCQRMRREGPAECQESSSVKPTPMEEIASEDPQEDGIPCQMTCSRVGGRRTHRPGARKGPIARPTVRSTKKNNPWLYKVDCSLSELKAISHQESKSRYKWDRILQAL